MIKEAGTFLLAAAALTSCTSSNSVGSGESNSGQPLKSPEITIAPGNFLSALERPLYPGPDLRSAAIFFANAFTITGQAGEFHSTGEFNDDYLFDEQKRRVIDTTLKAYEYCKILIFTLLVEIFLLMTRNLL
ncbi:MAG TPA: hypothetical protein VKC89_03115 [Patescibacteria group bacterium]|nr:hypothetical protein [Patescibacteria group bacterium]